MDFQHPTTECTRVLTAAFLSVSVGLGPGVAEQIAVHVTSRSVSQVRSHAQKYFLRLYRGSPKE
ncbi:hypothetical protein T484DRAFT_1793883 [Baffinella frigidus]|nr:hypothetical protein T484DRAFT_1793883 [Cryptophyta sp. CCMP2293]